MGKLIYSFQKIKNKKHKKGQTVGFGAILWAEKKNVGRRFSSMYQQRKKKTLKKKATLLTMDQRRLVKMQKKNIVLDTFKLKRKYKSVKSRSLLTPSLLVVV